MFDKPKSTINEHSKNIYKENGLSEEGTKRKFGNSEFSDTNGRRESLFHTFVTNAAKSFFRNAKIGSNDMLGKPLYE